MTLTAYVPITHTLAKGCIMSIAHDFLVGTVTALAVRGIIGICRAAERYLVPYTPSFLRGDVALASTIVS